MPTTTISLASFQDACAECADAIAASDWSGAYNWYARAQAILVGLPADSTDAAQRTRLEQDLAALKAAIDAAKVADSTDDARHLISTQTAHKA